MNKSIPEYYKTEGKLPQKVVTQIMRKQLKARRDVSNELKASLLKQYDSLNPRHLLARIEISKVVTSILDLW